MNSNCLNAPKTTSSLTRLLESWRFRIIALLLAVLPGCVHPQRNVVTPKEPAKAADTDKSSSKDEAKDELIRQIEYEAVVQGNCIRAREIRDRLINEDEQQLGKMRKEFWELLENCEELDKSEDQKRGQ